MPHRRLALTIPTLVGVMIILFVMLRTMPGRIIELTARDPGVGDDEIKRAARSAANSRGSRLEARIRYG